MCADSVGGFETDVAFRKRLEALRIRVADALRAGGLVDEKQLDAALIEYMISRSPNVSALRALHDYVNQHIEEEIRRRERGGVRGPSKPDAPQSDEGSGGAV